MIAARDVWCLCEATPVEDVLAMFGLLCLVALFAWGAWAWPRRRDGE